MEVIIIIAIILIVWWIKTGNKGKKLYNNLEYLLTSNYGWSSDEFNFVWSRFNKDIVNMQLDGMSEKEIAKKLNENFKNH